MSKNNKMCWLSDLKEALDEVRVSEIGNLFEASYPGNLGLMEMMKFYQVANPSQRKEMERILEKNDWEGFKRLIKEVLGIKLL